MLFCASRATQCVFQTAIGVQMQVAMRKFETIAALNDRLLAVLSAVPFGCNMTMEISMMYHQHELLRFHQPTKTGHTWMPQSTEYGAEALRLSS